MIKKNTEKEDKKEEESEGSEGSEEEFPRRRKY